MHKNYNKIEILCRFVPIKNRKNGSIKKNTDYYRHHLWYNCCFIYWNVCI